MNSTPVYGWPYANRSTDPLTYGIVSGEDVLLAIEATVSGVALDVSALDTRIDTLESAKIGEVLLAAPATSISFTGIATSWRAIEVVWTSRDDFAGFNADNIFMRVNNDSGTNYRYGSVQVNNSAVTGANVVGAVRGLIGITARGGAAAGIFGAGNVMISGWNAPHTTHLVYSFNSGIFDTAVGTGWSVNGSGNYIGAGPYTRLDFFPNPGATNFVAGTQFVLYGRR